LPLLWSAPQPKVLVVCEGPFDAMWLTCFGHSFGVYATCLFGLSMSAPQSWYLSELKQRFPRVVVLLDAAATFQAFKIAHSGLDLSLRRLPDSVKDPAKLPPQAAVDLCLELAG
jgi:hypothetical protein